MAFIKNKAPVIPINTGAFFVYGATGTDTAFIQDGIQ